MKCKCEKVMRSRRAGNDSTVYTCINCGIELVYTGLNVKPGKWSGWRVITPGKSGLSINEILGAVKSAPAVTRPIKLN